MTAAGPDHDVVIVGAGPAGRGLAHRCVSRGLDVAILDPRPHATWTSTLACWSDELPLWMPSDVIAAQVNSVQMRSPAVDGTKTTEIKRSYSVFDTAALQRSLTINGTRTVAERAVTVDDNRVITAHGATLTAKVVVDARGASGGGPRQTAWGMIVPRAQAAPILDGAGAILMDWTPSGSPGDSHTPSFLYVIPLDDDRMLLEETCLAGEPPIPVRRLRNRLESRLGHLSLTPIGDEVVSFCLRGVSDSPWRERPLLFGARGDLMHPATGYSVATSLRMADTVADAVAAGQDAVAALWPSTARQVQRLRLAGVQALLSLKPDQLRTFFELFAEMPVERQRAYLSGRDDLRGTASAMNWLFGHADSPARRAMVMATAARVVPARLSPTRRRRQSGR